MLIALVSVIVAAVVGVPVVSKMLDSVKEPPPPPEPPTPKTPSGSEPPIQEVTVADRAGHELPARVAAPVKVNPDAVTPEQDPFSDMDLQELAALTNSPALLQMMGMELPDSPPTQPTASDASTPPKTTPKQTPSSSRAAPPKQVKAPKKSLVSVNWEGEWSTPPNEVAPPQDEVEKQRGTPSADALFMDSDVPVITKTPANYRRKSSTPAPSPKATAPKEVKPNRPQKLREVAPTQNQVTGAQAPKPPLKLFVEDAPDPLLAQSPYEVIQPTSPQRQAPRSGVFQRSTGSDAYGSARETHLDFQPFFALDALRVINEARAWSRSQKSRLSEVSREELGVIINEELPEWSLLLSHVNGFLFDLAQDQLRHRQMEWGVQESTASMEISKPSGGASFRQSQWQNVATEEFIAKSSAPKSKTKPRGPKRFMREG